MLALINRILDWFKSLFWKEEMELTLVGLQYSGKTTFVNVIAVSVFPLFWSTFDTACDQSTPRIFKDKELVCYQKHEKFQENNVRRRWVNQFSHVWNFKPFDFLLRILRYSMGVYIPWIYYYHLCIQSAAVSALSLHPYHVQLRIICSVSISEMHRKMLVTQKIFLVIQNVSMLEFTHKKLSHYRQ